MAEAGWFSSFPLLRATARIRSCFGHTPSLVMLGRIYETGRVPGRDITDANEYYLRAASAGDIQGMWHFGVNHLASKAGVTDHEVALHWLERAAGGGHAMAAWALGKMYLAGKLVAVDQRRGLQLLEQSARQQCPQARQSLIEIYSEGRYGVARDDAQAALWVTADE